LGRDTDAAAALVTAPWPLDDCAKRVSRPLALPALTRDEPVNLSDSCPKTHQHFRQPMPVAASRCHLIQMLRSALTCTNGCSCWSTDEENSPRNFPYHGCSLATELGNGAFPLVELSVSESAQ
jgi:hypothetical protein